MYRKIDDSTIIKNRQDLYHCFIIVEIYVKSLVGYGEHWFLTIYLSNSNTYTKLLSYLTGKES